MAASRVSVWRTGVIQAAFAECPLNGVYLQDERRLNKAEECERLATQAQDPDVKAAFVVIARQWRKLARQIGQLERDR